MFSEITLHLAVASAFDDIPPGWQKLDVRGLIDGPGNSETLIDEYVSDGIRRLKNHNLRLVVLCDYGQSRSNFIAARILMHLRSVTLEEAIGIVRAAHSDSSIKPSLLSDVSATADRPAITRIVVTGGRGFVGRKLCDQLIRCGYSCLSLSRGDSGNYMDSSKTLDQAAGWFQPDLVIHLAHPRPLNSEAALQTALAQLISVASWCEDNRVSLLFPSGWVVFDGSDEQQVMSTTHVQPHTRYGRLKAMIEVYLTAAWSSGLNVRILRLPGMFGEDSPEPRFLSYFANCVATRRQIVYHQFANGSARVPLIGIDECVTAFAEAIKDFQHLPPISHMGSVEQSPTVEEIALHLSDSTGVETKGSVVQRNAFRGYFVPDIAVPIDGSLSARINDFILHLCRKSHDTE